MEIIFNAKNLCAINMCLPKETITRIDPSEKINLFVSYLVDEELNARFKPEITAKNSKQHLFTNEIEYLEDIRKAKYGPTVKRAGWDCLRHYEYASQGTILCFKNLDKKPETCAPHGLNSSNAIIYNNADELLNTINNMSERQYVSLYNETYKWIEKNTTENVAKNFLNEFYN